MSIESDNLKYLRKDQQISQQELADILDVSKQYLSRVENDITELSKQKVIELCQHFGLSINWFLTGKGPVYFTDFMEGYMLAKDACETVVDSTVSVIVYSRYCEFAYGIIKEKDSNATLENIHQTARYLFMRDYGFKKMQLEGLKVLMDKLEKEVFPSEEFKTRVIEEYYLVLLERQTKT